MCDAAHLYREGRSLRERSFHATEREVGALPRFAADSADPNCAVAVAACVADACCAAERAAADVARTSL